MRSLTSCGGHLKCGAIAAVFLSLCGCVYSYHAIDYPDPDVQETVAQGIGNSGVIVGYYRSRKDPFNKHAFLRDAGGKFSAIDFPNASDTVAYKITLGGAGQIVGTTTTHGFIKDGNAIDPIDKANGIPTAAYGINSLGQVVGVFYDRVGVHAFLDEANNFRTLDIPNQQETHVTAVNDKMAITGFAYDGHARGISGDLQGNFVFFIAPGATQTEAWGINNHGEIVGSADKGLNNSFLRSASGAFTTVRVPQGSLTQAYGINDQSQIVGSFVDGNGTHAFLANPPCHRRDCREQGPPR